MDTLGQGKVNETWFLSTGSEHRLVLQKLPVSVFPNPEMVMHNFRLVTEYMKKNFGHKTFLDLQQNHQGNDFFLDPLGNGYRMCHYIENSITFEQLRAAEQGGAIGYHLGEFHLQFSSLDHDLFLDPLPDFHDIGSYLQYYDDTLASVSSLKPEEIQCANFIEDNRHIAFEFMTIRNHLTTSVTHGDPKISNFLFEKDSDRVLALIDLDTVKPGLLLHDLGDCLRSCCNVHGEEMQSSDHQVFFCTKAFTRVLQGYWQTAGHLLGAYDRDYLVQATRLLCFELGLRFFTDHLLQDRYFKTSHHGQNLSRARVQFLLMESINSNWSELEEIVESVQAQYI